MGTVVEITVAGSSEQKARSALRDAVEISMASGGSFDVTVLPITDLWMFDQAQLIPDKQQIAKILPKVGYDKLIFGEKNLSVGFSTPGMGIDLGAIAKGWAVDRAMEKIVDGGIRNAINRRRRGCSRPRLPPG